MGCIREQDKGHEVVSSICLCSARDLNEKRTVDDISPLYSLLGIPLPITYDFMIDEINFDLLLQLSLS
jgi:hypothetical protein